MPIFMDFTTKQKKASGEKNHDKRKENVIKEKDCVKLGSFIHYMDANTALEGSNA